MVDERAPPSATAKDKERYLNVPGYGATKAEKHKRDATRTGSQDRMEDRLKARGIKFTPIGFDTSGTPGRAWSKFIKTLSGIAHTRRQHDRKTFKMKWTMRISVIIAKTGANVMLRRAAAISGAHAARRRNRSEDWHDGPLGAPHAEDLITVPYLSAGA